MGNVIFCATDFYLQGGYRSYTDFFKLVELSGYPVIPLSQLDPQSDNTYIITPLNDEWLDGWQQPKAYIIHWELEWRTDWRADVNEPPGVAEVWASDKWYANKIGARYVPVGGNAGLNECPDIWPLRRIKGVAQISYQTHRRQVITHQLREYGLSLMPTENQWGTARSAGLLSSRVMLHVHQHDNMPTIAPLRWCLAAAHKLPMITETVNERGIFSYSYMVQADYKHLAEFTANVLKDERMLRDYALALHQLLCEQYTFQKVVEANV
jgi:hypothetical protein